MYTFNIRCGNWIFPARGTSTSAEYPVDFPLVAEIYPPSTSAGQTVSDAWQIDKHLTGPRFLTVELEEEDRSIHIVSLKNSNEELFEQSVGFRISFAPELLTREGCLWHQGRYPGKIVRNSDVRLADWEAVFFTSILLQAHLSGVKLPDGIKFRPAKMAEVESLGRWQR
jgi:hypothetical protein